MSKKKTVETPRVEVGPVLSFTDAWKWVSKAVSDDPHRKVLCDPAIVKRNGATFMEATNTHILAIAKVADIYGKENGPVTLSGQGEWPKTDRVIPTEFIEFVELEAGKIRDAVKPLKELAKRTVWRLTIEQDGPDLRLSARDAIDRIEASAVIPIKNGKSIRFCVNYNYLLASFAPAEDNQIVRIEMTIYSRPLVVTIPYLGDSWKAVVMPMALH